MRGKKFSTGLSGGFGGGGGYIRSQFWKFWNFMKICVLGVEVSKKGAEVADLSAFLEIEVISRNVLVSRSAQICHHTRWGWASVSVCRRHLRLRRGVREAQSPSPAAGASAARYATIWQNERTRVRVWGRQREQQSGSLSVLCSVSPQTTQGPTHTQYICKAHTHRQSDTRTRARTRTRTGSIKNQDPRTPPAKRQGTEMGL